MPGGDSPEDLDAPQALVPHFCVIQAEEQGLSGWDSKHDCRRHRWDVLLETLQKSLALDGKWGTDVKASLFAGADAIHVTGEIQNLAMPFLKKQGGRSVSSPCSVQAWEQLLWKHYLQDAPGLRWEFRGPTRSRREAQQMVCDRLRRFLGEVPFNSVVLAFTARGSAGTTYDALKTAGMHLRLTGTTHVYLLLGGAHGFDYENDSDGSFFEEVLALFSQWLGPERVARVRLCQPAGRLVKFPTASLAAFLRVEHACGMLHYAVAGLHACSASSADAGGGAPRSTALVLQSLESRRAEESSEETSDDAWQWGEAPGLEQGWGQAGAAAEELACRQQMWSLRGTWRDTRGSTYEIASDGTWEYLTVHITRPGGRTLEKSISVGRAAAGGGRGDRRLQVLWDSGTFVVVSPLPEDEGRPPPETVEWKSVGGRRTFTWRRASQLRGGR